MVDLDWESGLSPRPEPFDEVPVQGVLQGRNLMKRRSPLRGAFLSWSCLFPLALLASAGGALAADTPPQKRVICDPDDPASKCPGESCLCTDDSLEIVFDRSSSAVLSHAEDLVGAPIDVSIYLETQSQDVQGWSYGVIHDPGVLRFQGACSLQPTGIDRLQRDEGALPGDGGLLAFSEWSCRGPVAHAVEFCVDHACKARVPADGWINVSVLSLMTEEHLPLGRNRIAYARYWLLKAPGPDGTWLHFTDHLARRQSTRVGCYLTVDGMPRVWGYATEAWLKSGSEEEASFHRADLDGSGKVSITDAILLARAVMGQVPPRFSCEDLMDADDNGRVDTADVASTLAYLFLHGPAIPPPAGDCTGDPTEDPLGCEASNCGG